eukprot:GHVQ01016007.1.p1 GENE.GHVQ01016007.1~~GHVQ01016007.1.p1  ORF type:complete len:458 (-),score=54.05 GHVQ01016007.1:701-2074(-)
MTHFFFTYFCCIFCVLLGFSDHVSCGKLVYTLNPECETRRVEVLREILQNVSFIITSNTDTIVAAEREDNTISTVTEFGTNSLAASREDCRLEDTWLKLVKAGIFSSDCLSDNNDNGGDQEILLLSAFVADKECINEVERNMHGDFIIPSEPKPLDEKLSAQTAPNDPLFDGQWALANKFTFSLKAETLWDFTTGGNGLADQQPGNTVGILDGGFLRSHTDLLAKWYENTNEICGDGLDNDSNGLIDDCSGWSFHNNNNDISIWPDPTARQIAHWHGTAVASCAAGTTNNGFGMAAIGAFLRVLPVSITVETALVLTGLNYIISQNVKVINMSFGFAKPSAVLYNVMKTADSTLFVIAAGNGACFMDNAASVAFDSGSSPAEIPSRRRALQSECGNYPAGFAYWLSNVVTVGAMTETGEMAEFSNHGGLTVQVFAPGDKVVAARNTGVPPVVSGRKR